ncbi:hypothetical protein Pcinc_043444, partial [Petrolisthes cinctipes]
MSSSLPPSDTRYIVQHILAASSKSTHPLRSSRLPLADNISAPPPTPPLPLLCPACPYLALGPLG